VGGTTSTYQKYWYDTARRKASRDITLTTNHLGSSNVTANTAGDRVTDLRYYPFGLHRYDGGAQKTVFRFTGQRIDASTDLYYYGARWYDPVVGRFLQADTIVPNPGNPQSLNRYTYVLNNPLRYTDPTGHYIFEDTWTDPTEANFSTGPYEHAGTFFLNPENAQSIYGVNTPMRVSMATVLDPTGIFGMVAGLVAMSPASADYRMTGGNFALNAGGLRAASVDDVSSSGGWVGTPNYGAAVVARANAPDAPVVGGMRVVNRVGINWSQTDPQGRSNVERASKGRAPLGPDGAPVQLHHVGQNPEGPIAEVTASTHKSFGASLHPLGNAPSAIDRSAFGIWRANYWSCRAGDALNVSPKE
jgi:RHS repeat-associated protein